jgi:serine/threonine protein phosphatase 1
MGFFRSLFKTNTPEGVSLENQLRIAHWPAAIYAIGDIHGCLDHLIELEQVILADITPPTGQKLVVTLGDYIDRGPNSAGVIEHLLRPLPHGFTRVPLAGNHEQLMLDALSGKGDKDWLEYGDTETLRSYGIDPVTYCALRPSTRKELLLSRVPTTHAAFLASLAISLELQQSVFVHAGIRRGVPIDQQDRQDLLWIRREFLEAQPTDGLLVIHGHTPVSEAEVLPGRIGLDTGAFGTGRLTAVRLLPKQPPAFFTTGG